MPIVARPRTPRRANLAAGATVLLVAALVGCTGPIGSPTGTMAVPSPPTAGGTSAAAPCTSTDPGRPATTWANRVFYEVFVRSFADSDGDGIGDLAGLTSRLDYLNDGDPATSSDLGVTGIWLMPIAEAVSYHGYDTTDYSTIERDYGSMADFQALVAAAHERGIAVVLDLVLNHTSSEHPWFRDALAGGEHRDWYLWSETDPGWPSVAGGNPWHAAPQGPGYYYGAFWEGMPDLNLRNPEVTAELRRVARAWLALGVDGFRVDAAKHLIENAADDQVNTTETKAWLADFRGAIHQGSPDALVLGEVWDARAVSASYTADGALDMAFDFGIGPALAFGVYGDSTTLLVSLEEVATRYEPGAGATFLANHDQPRILTQLRGDTAAQAQAAAALLTGPGVPFIYYGEEVGMLGSKPDPQIRAPLPWTGEPPGFGFTTGTPWEPFGDGAASVNVAALTGDPASLLSQYRALIRLRTDHPALSRGTFARAGASSRSIAATVRAAGDERLLVLQNLSDAVATGPTLVLESGPLCGAPEPTLLYDSTRTMTAPQIPAPMITASGGFTGYVPLTELPASSTVVIDLSR